jgi:NAD(P)-dependent dehydrogenase (short-subunit alcohol dehydrogenase family)
MNALAGKRALVTGGAVRVGRAIALALGSAQMRVAVHYHSSGAAADSTCREIVQRGGDAFAISADLEDRGAARRLVDDVTERLGGLDLLVLSAASFERVPFDALDDAAFDRSLHFDLASQFALAHQAVPALQREHGSIVFITCSSATTPFRNYLPYVVAKGALRHLMRTLALELAPAVRVNAVAPGTVLPPETMSPGAIAALAARVPLGRIGSAEDIAAAVVYLAQSPFVTGHEIVVDGGRSVANIERFG